MSTPAPSKQSSSRLSIIFSKHQLEEETFKKTKGNGNNNNNNMTMVKSCSSNDNCTCCTTASSVSSVEDENLYQPTTSFSTVVTPTDTIHESTTTISSSSSSISNTSSSSGSTKKSVSFGSINIRNFNITISSHPACQRGPAITFGNDYTDFQHEIPVDTYERIRLNKRSRCEDDLYMSPIQRICILRLWGVSDAEMKNAQEERERVQENRKETKEMVLKRMKRKEKLSSFFSLVHKNKNRRKSNKQGVKRNVTKPHSTRPKVMICANEC